MRADLFFRRMKRSISSYGIALPIDNLDQFIKDILEDTTIPVFSIYCPRYDIVTCSVNEFTKGDIDMGEYCDLYILPDRLFVGREVLYVRKVEYLHTTSSSPYRYPTYIPNMSTMGYVNYEDILLANAQKPLSDALIPPLTFHYEYPKKLYIYDDLINSSLKLTIACEHDRSLQSIPPTAQESLFTLGELDVMAALYELVKHYDEVGGAYDKTQLKIERWANAANDRKSLIAEWDEAYGLDFAGFEFG